MNRNLLIKIIDEINKPEPKLDYVLGILDTVLEQLPDNTIKATYGTTTTLLPASPIESTYVSPVIPNVVTDGVESLELAAKAKVAGLQKAEIQ